MNLEYKIENVKCEKCGGMNIVRVQEDLPKPPIQTMSEYISDMKGVHVQTLEMRYHKLCLKCKDCGFEKWDLVI